MNLHPLPDDVKCPFCGKAGLAFLRERRSQGDLYHCTAAIPCRGLTIHYRTRLGCGISAETASGQRLNWMECLTAQLPLPEETDEHLTTLQTAVRLRISKKMVIDLVSRGKLPGRKIGARWLIPAATVRRYNQTAMVRHRVSGASG
jgi:excisionase family DNA binding protein